jgi:hypothetical protein
MLLDTTLHCYKKNVLPFFLLLSLLSTAVGRLRTVQYSTRYPYRHLQYSVLYSIQYCIPGYSTEYSIYIYIQYYTVQYKVSIIKYTVSIKCTI